MSVLLTSRIWVNKRNKEKENPSPSSNSLNESLTPVVKICEVRFYVRVDTLLKSFYKTFWLNDSDQRVVDKLFLLMFPRSRGCENFCYTKWKLHLWISSWLYKSQPAQPSFVWSLCLQSTFPSLRSSLTQIMNLISRIRNIRGVKVWIL